MISSPCRVAVGLLGLTLLGLFGSAAFAETVKVEGGLLQGTVEDGLRVYRGIPYAAPPIGDLRWRPPQPAPIGKACARQTSLVVLVYRQVRQSQICPQRRLSVPERVDASQARRRKPARSGLDSWGRLRGGRTGREALPRRMVG